ncbi:MAG: hypothetical protein JKY33_06425 [Bacteroidia bacterium]|nr:hypothetical protein [Bacteroidia bacterium]
MKRFHLFEVEQNLADSYSQSYEVNKINVGAILDKNALNYKDNLSTYVEDLYYNAKIG